MPFAHPPPNDGIPQEPSEQPSHESGLPETFALKDEISFMCLVELHLGQVISSCFSFDLCKTSYFVLHSLHLYSKTGILLIFLFMF